MRFENEIKDLLTKSARKLTVHDILTVFLLCLTYFIFAQFLFVTLDHYYHFDKLERIISFSTAFFPPVFYFMHYCSSRSARKLNLIYIAQEIEKDNPQLENRLVSHLLSKTRNSHSSKKLIEDLQTVKLSSSEFSKKTVISSRALAAILFLAALYSISSVRSIPLSLARLYVPFLDAPAPSKNTI